MSYVCGFGAVLEVSLCELVAEVHWADAVQHAGEAVGSSVVDVLDELGVADAEVDRCLERRAYGCPEGGFYVSAGGEPELPHLHDHRDEIAGLQFALECVEPSVGVEVVKCEGADGDELGSARGHHLGEADELVLQRGVDGVVCNVGAGVARDGHEIGQIWVVDVVIVVQLAHAAVPVSVVGGPGLRQDGGHGGGAPPGVVGVVGGDEDCTYYGVSLPDGDLLLLGVVADIAGGVVHSRGHVSLHAGDLVLADDLVTYVLFAPALVVDVIKVVVVFFVECAVEVGAVVDNPLSGLGALPDGLHECFG
mmetsp:Transcript_11547/g.25666  ORF Transcript_11547/g.25666 Transcript_11547/m.25666 type:complete len:307 (-) Transcript_11547:1908-2828(-)